MTTGEFFRKLAVETDRVKAAVNAGRICDQLRSRGLTYDSIARLAYRAGIDGPDWDALLHESESLSA